MKLLIRERRAAISFYLQQGDQQFPLYICGLLGLAILVQFLFIFDRDEMTELPSRSIQKHPTGIARAVDEIGIKGDDAEKCVFGSILHCGGVFCRNNTLPMAGGAFHIIRFEHPKAENINGAMSFVVLKVCHDQQCKRVSLNYEAPVYGVDVGDLFPDIFELDRKIRLADQSFEFCTDIWHVCYDDWAFNSRQGALVDVVAFQHGTPLLSSYRYVHNGRAHDREGEKQFKPSVPANLPPSGFIAGISWIIGGYLTLCCGGVVGVHIVRRKDPFLVAAALACFGGGLVMIAHGANLYLDAKYAAWTSGIDASATCYSSHVQAFWTNQSLLIGDSQAAL